MTIMPSDGERANRKFHGLKSISRKLAANATVNTDEPNERGEHEAESGLMKVVDDYFAIDKVVGWRGKGYNREYRIRWAGQTPDRDQWLKPSALCQETLREAHALVRADRARQKTAIKAIAKVKDNDAPSIIVKGKKSSNKKRKKPPAETRMEECDNRHAGFTLGECWNTQTAIGRGKNQVAHSSHKDRTNKVFDVEQVLAKGTGTNVEAVEKAEIKKAGVKRSRKYRKRAAEDDDAAAGMDPDEWIRRERARGNDIELVDFQPVRRINVNEENAREIVSESRKNGIPVVLTGHLGWPQFAARWLKDVSESDPLDLAHKHVLDIESMIRDIGDEEVPIVEKDYDERNPTASVMKASVFIEKHWPKNGEIQDSRKKLYMQQWQFPYSDEAANTICGPSMCSPPPCVFYEDLLPFWLDQGGNPYQYLFMGDTDTMSKLHKDPGGLDILISPIVGEKECILAHRLDEDHLYNLRSKLDKIDLHHFPMTAFARLWKTTIKPGEILVMPHDTYHQCRNVTPCLSYHRLHLDAINLRGFLESMYAGDAKNMEHTEVLWNTGYGLMERVEDYLKIYKLTAANDGCQNDSDAKQQSTVNAQFRTEKGIAETVKVLRLLQSACLGVARVLEDPRASSRNWLTYTPEDWKKLVGDIGETLYDYWHRDKEDVPRYRRPNLDISLTGADFGASHYEDSSDDERKEEYSGKWHLPSVYKGLESSIGKLPYLRPNEEDVVMHDSVKLKVGDEILVRLDNRRAQGTVKKINNMTALLVTYDKLPSCFDEFQPRTQVHGRTNTSKHAIPSALRPSLDASQGIQQIVRCVPSGDPTKQLRRARAVSSRTGTFYHVELPLDCGNTVRRWMCRDSFIQKIA